MTGGACIKKIFFLKILIRACIKKLKGAGGEGLTLKSSIQGKMLAENGIEKASVTQYVMWRWQEKLLFTENARQGWDLKSFNLIF